MYEDLKEHLSNNILPMVGAWVKKPTNYENDLCEILFMEVDKGRHWDAQWGNYFIEIKKGNSIWLDLVRYSELLVEGGLEIDSRLVNLFFIPDQAKEQIKEILCVTTKSIIIKLNLDLETAEKIIEVSKIVPRQLNAQASLTVNDIRNICEFSLEYS